jgi:transcriptional regulator with XRE-family HTH domain
MFLNKIDYWIKKKGIKKRFIAKECEVSEQTVSSWCANKTQPDLKQSFILARILDVSVDDLGEFSDDLKEKGVD